ncbi:lysis system i-spanin subunit Rz [Pantoea vagans]|uniref:lysis system i-spanin subunit Rz n=1 Tax=Pantoea vagans TaxID=470934 RepID=UPI00224E2112|nr:lysis system i-spanin subunit Rz [Pantoea vagans]
MHWIFRPIAAATAYEKLTTSLTDAAQQDHFTLRESIEVAGKQIAGLQKYIKEQCRNLVKITPSN